jgi:hypothetical protein
MASPTPHNSQASHGRGVSRNRGHFPGTTVLRAHTCGGHLAGRLEVPDHALTQAKIDGLSEMLEDDCPSDPTRHGTTCPFDERRLRAVLSRNREVLSSRHAPRLRLHLPLEDPQD